MTAFTTDAPSVLVVDSDAGLRHVIVRLLQRHSYHVLQAENTLAALAVLQHSARPIHALIIDLEWPLSKAYARIHAIRVLFPALPIIVMTAWPLQATPADLPVSGYLEKPFSLSTLHAMIRRALVQPQPVDNLVQPCINQGVSYPWFDSPQES